MHPKHSSNQGKSIKGTNQLALTDSQLKVVTDRKNNLRKSRFPKLKEYKMMADPKLARKMVIFRDSSKFNRLTQNIFPPLYL